MSKRCPIPEAVAHRVIVIPNAEREAALGRLSLLAGVEAMRAEGQRAPIRPSLTPRMLEEVGVDRPLNKLEKQYVARGYRSVLRLGAYLRREGHDVQGVFDILRRGQNGRVRAELMQGGAA